MKNKGFTIIELLMSLGISTIVMGLILTFFITAYKGYKSVRNNSEMDFHAQYILNFMAGKIVDSDYMCFLRVDTKNYNMETVRSAGVEYPLHNISFRYGNEDGNYAFAIRNNIISYGKKNTEPTVELGNYVEEMYISLLNDESFQNARAVKIKIVMKKGGQTYEAFQTAYMRNN